MKLQFIRIKTEHVYIGRWRTTSFNESKRWVNKIWSNNGANSNTTLYILLVTWTVMQNKTTTTVLLQHSRWRVFEGQIIELEPFIHSFIIHFILYKKSWQTQLM